MKSYKLEEASAFLIHTQVQKGRSKFAVRRGIFGKHALRMSPQAPDGVQNVRIRGEEDFANRL